MIIKYSLRRKEGDINYNNLSTILKGDWIDIFTNEDVEIKKGTTDFVSTGLNLIMPPGIECHLLLRSSTPKKYGVMLAHSMGIIDNSFRGPDDIIKLHLYSFKKNIFIPKGTRIAQVKFVPSQKATIWQKLKWLFSRKLRFKCVETNTSENRGGYGSTDL